MGTRAIKRQIAKARMTIMGVGNVNKKLSLKNNAGRKNWKVALYGKTGEEAHRAQMNLGKLIKARDENRKNAIENKRIAIKRIKNTRKVEA